MTHQDKLCFIISPIGDPDSDLNKREPRARQCDLPTIAPDHPRPLARALAARRPVILRRSVRVVVAPGSVR